MQVTALRRHVLGDHEADALGGAGDEDGLAFEVDVHVNYQPSPASRPATQSSLRRLRKLVCGAGDPRLSCIKQDVDGIATRACPSCAYQSAASRVYPTCGDKPGHDDRGISLIQLEHFAG